MAFDSLMSDLKNLHENTRTCLANPAFISDTLIVVCLPYKNVATNNKTFFREIIIEINES